MEDLYRVRKSKRKYVKRVWLPPQMIDMVERLNKQWWEGPIFRGRTGKPCTGDVVTMCMYKLRLRLQKKGIALPDGLTVYGLRHSFATNFIKQLMRGPSSTMVHVLGGHRGFRGVMALKMAHCTL